MMEQPFYRVHTDLTGPFNAIIYILVIKDAMTKWVEFIPIINKTAEEVVKAAVAVFSVLGYPHIWITDRGSEADNHYMRQLKKLLSYHHIMTTPRNPRSDGQVESSMGPLKDSLSQFISKHQDDWNEWLPALASGYRQTINVATGYTPNYLMFGRELCAPSEEHLHQNFEGTVSKYVKDLREALVYSWESTGERVVENVVQYNSTPRERLVFKPYEVGQWFFTRRVPKRFFTSKKDKKKSHLSAKLQMRYCGPYRITKIINPVLYEADIHNTIKRVHAVNMKPA
jgi:hypothetical protein